MPTPICVKCRMQMRCVKNDYLVRDGEAGFGSTYWVGDEYDCPGCGLGIVTGFGKPLTRHPGGVTYGEALEFRYEVPASDEKG